MGLYVPFGSIAEANAAQNEADAQADGYASYADMLAAQSGGPWAAIARGEQVDVWSPLVSVGQAMAASPAAVEESTSPAPPPVGPSAYDPVPGSIAFENLHCAENGGELLGDVATGMCVYQMIDGPYPEADPGMIIARAPSKLPTLLILGGVAVAAYLFLKR